MDVKTLCLGVLMLGDASGYEIKKQFEEGPFAHFHRAGFGSIYPALSALLDDHLVTCTETQQDGRPDKKVYSITAEGREALRRSLRREPVPDRVISDTAFMFFFAEMMDRDHLARVYDSYLDHYRRKAAHVRGLSPEGISQGRLFNRGLGLAFYDAVVRYLEENRDALLTDEAPGAADPPLERVEAGR